MATNWPAAYDTAYNPHQGDSEATGAPGDLAAEITNLNDRTIAMQKRYPGGTASTPVGQINLRSDTAANWTAANPILGLGEVGWESNTGRVKVGDGTTAWSSLGYALSSSTTGLYPLTGGGQLTTAQVASYKSQGYAGVFLDWRNVWDLSALSLSSITDFTIQSIMTGSIGYSGNITVPTGTNGLGYCSVGSGADGLSIFASGTNKVQGINLRGLTFIGSNTNATVHIGGGARRCFIEHCCVINNTANTTTTFSGTASTAINSFTGTQSLSVASTTNAYGNGGVAWVATSTGNAWISYTGVGTGVLSGVTYLATDNSSSQPGVAGTIAANAVVTFPSFGLVDDSVLSGTNSECWTIRDTDVVGAGCTVGIGPAGTAANANDTIWNGLTTYAGYLSGSASSGTLSPYSLVMAGGGNHQFRNYYDRSQPSVHTVVNLGAKPMFDGGEDDNQSSTGTSHFVSSGNGTTITNRTVTSHTAPTVVLSGVGRFVVRGRSSINGTFTFGNPSSSCTLDLGDSAIQPLSNLAVSGSAGTLVLAPTYAGNQTINTSGWTGITRGGSVPGRVYVNNLTTDGTGDNTAAIIAAIGSLPTGSGTVLLPTGTIACDLSATGTLITANNVTLEGQGRTSTTLVGVTAKAGSQTAVVSLTQPNLRLTKLKVDGGTGCLYGIYVKTNPVRIFDVIWTGGTIANLFEDSGSGSCEYELVVSGGAGGSKTVRTISGTLATTSGVAVVSDSGNSFSPADVNRLIEGTGIPQGSVISSNKATTVSAGSNGATLASLVGGSLLVASTFNWLSSGGQFTVVASGGTATLSYTSITGGAAPSLNGIAIVSGTGTWTVATGNAVTSLTTVAIDQPATATGTAGTATVFQGCGAVFLGNDQRVTNCVFGSGPTRLGGGGGLIAATHITFLNPAGSAGLSSVLFEGSWKAAGCYFDSCPTASTLTVPAGVAVSTATTGGSIPASTTRYYTVTAVNAAGETVASAEVTVTTGAGTATNANSVTWNAVQGAASYSVYASTATGTETRQVTGVTGTSWTDTAASLTAGASAPTSNTAWVTQGANIVHKSGGGQSVLAGCNFYQNASASSPIMFVENDTATSIQIIGGTANKSKAWGSLFNLTAGANNNFAVYELWVASGATTNVYAPSSGQTSAPVSVNIAGTRTTYNIASSTPTGSQQFSASGTYNIPSGATLLRVTLVGAGGGGGGAGAAAASTTTLQTGGGGGGNGGVDQQVVSVGTNTSLTVTPGTAGTGGTGGAVGAAGTVGTAGGNTTTVGNTTGINLSVTGGAPGGASAANSTANVGGGNYGKAGQTSPTATPVPGNGGVSGAGAAPGVSQMAGGGGGGGPASATNGGGGGNAGAYGGSGAAAGASGGSATVNGTNGASPPATSYGAGGGGGGGGAAGTGTGGNGGNGASGWVLIEVIG